LINPKSAAGKTIERRGIYQCEVLQNLVAGPDMHLLRLHCPPIAMTSQPGQFVNIQTSEELVPLLRKPFSVCRRDQAAGWFEVLFRIVGKGTQQLSRLQPGDLRSVIGPLGHGFKWEPQGGFTALLVAGGIGIAPMPFLAEELRHQGFGSRVFIGAKTAAELWGEREFGHLAHAWHVSTDDGSRGFNGVVTDQLLAFLTDPAHAGKNWRIFACGPEPMLQRVLRIGRQHHIPTQIAVETMMGCGFGICMGCPMPRPRRQQAESYLLACVDGPVFDANEVEVTWQT